MAADWSERRVGDLVRQGILVISDGYRVRNEELGPQGIPFVRGGDIGDGWINTTTRDHIRPELAERVAAKIARPADAAFITKGNVGRAGRLRPGQPPVVFAPQVAYWRVTDTDVLDSGFVFYLIRSREFQAALDGVKTHGAMVADYVSISQQHDFRFRIPDIDSQRAVSRILGGLDDKIELNRRMNETLEALVAASFEAATDSTGTRPLRELASPSRESLDPSASPDEQFDHFSIPAFDGRRGPSVDLGAAIRSTKLVVHPDAVLVSKLNPRIPRVWLPFVSEARRAICSTEFLALRPETGTARALVYTAVRSRSFREDLASLATGTSGSHQRARVDDILSLDIPVPDDPGAFVARAEPLIERVAANERESRTLAALRDALLPKLISGELRIRDPEHTLESG